MMDSSQLLGASQAGELHVSQQVSYTLRLAQERSAAASLAYTHCYPFLFVIALRGDRERLNARVLALNAPEPLTVVTHHKSALLELVEQNYE
jgi:hypothetical protein